MLMGLFFWWGDLETHRPVHLLAHQLGRVVYRQEAEAAEQVHGTRGVRARWLFAHSNLVLRGIGSSWLFAHSNLSLTRVP